MNSIPIILKMSTVLEILALVLYFLYSASILWFLAFSFTIADICEKLQKSSDKN